MFYLIVLLYMYYRSFSLRKECRILQLNHYQNDRTLAYILKKKCDYKSILFHSPFFVLFFIKETEMLFLFLLIVYSLLRLKKETAFRELVYTARMKRLLFLLFFLYTIILYISYVYHCFVMVGLIFMGLDKEMVYFANMILTPLENGIRNVYVIKAKRMLEKHPDLIKVGIVGSYGKTSTKNILFHLIKENYICLKSKGSYNNKMGNCITILRQLNRLHSLFICEMGSDHVGEIASLMRFIKPQYVIITSIGNQHLNTFKTQENIIYEKMSPLLYMKKHEIAVLNIDCEYIYKHRNIGICKKVSFGERKDSDYRVEDIVLKEDGSTFNVVYKEEKYAFEIGLLGYYNVMNVVGAIAMAHTLQVSMETMQRIVRSIQPIEHRMQSIQKKNYTLIDNAFNSNMYSFKNSMDVLRNISKYRILITPGIIDVKEDEEINYALMKEVVDACDEVVLVGKRNRNAMKEGLNVRGFMNYCCVDTMEEALSYVDMLDLKDFVVLIENDIDKTMMNLI